MKQKKHAPLAERMRPVTFDDLVGQDELIGPSALIRKLVQSNEVPSMILWGPPGSGKTSLAHVIAHQVSYAFLQFSAVSCGLPEFRKVVTDAKNNRALHNKQTILFLDEIHRWNKAQQDALLPHVESGLITLVGATTENPSFSINSALLSRCRVFVLKPLAIFDIVKLLERALADTVRGLGNVSVHVAPQTLELCATIANGDARVALNTLELAVSGMQDQEITKDDIAAALQRANILYDKEGEEHYNLISALHKSMRGSDVDASLYWLGRMLEAGADPMYVARRVVRFASEDIGLADPQALIQAVSAMYAAKNIGMPECNVMLAQAVAYCARAKKSNALYAAYCAIQQDIHAGILPGVPLHLRNAPTKLMKDLGYSKGYQYNPEVEGLVDQDYLPQELKKKKYLKQ